MKNSYNKTRKRHLQYENLEKRELMAVTGALRNGVLTVTGTSKNDVISFRQTAGNVYVSGITTFWGAWQINSVVIDAGKGNDTVSFDSVSNGGQESLAESITLRTTTSGTDQVRFPGNHSVSLSGKGHTLTVSNTGVVTVDGAVQSWSNPTPDPNPPTPPNPNPNPSPSPTVTNWFDSNIIDSALKTLGSSLYTDGLIDRNDIIALLRNAEDGNTIDTTEFNDLKAIVGNSSLFGSLDYVKSLTSYVVNGTVANANYQATVLGNLYAGSNGVQMEKLINKWFLGLDRPTASGTYRQIAGTLFVNGASYSDINQGYLGDCYFMASLAETALKNPSAIANMFVVNGDGTYTVRFFNNGQPTYVTVDSYLPTDGYGNLIYAGIGKSYANSANELWTSLAEKAYVQTNEFGYIRGYLSGSGQNNYSAVEGGYIYAALGQISGQATTPWTMTSGTSSFTAFVTAFNAGKSIGFASKVTPASSSVVGSHAYAVLSYDANNQTVTLFNPWGTQYGLVTMTWAEIQGSFSYFDRTA